MIQSTYLEASHIAWIAGILKAVLVALEEELEEESESRGGPELNG